MACCWVERLFVRQVKHHMAVAAEEHFCILAGYYARHYGPGIAVHQDMILHTSLEEHYRQLGWEAMRMTAVGDAGCGDGGGPWLAGQIG